MPRLFVALDLAEQAVSAITKICTPAGTIRWVPSNQLHLTLRFIGSVDGEMAATLRQKLSMVAGEPCELQLQGVGQFPGKGAPRILWVGVKECRALSGLRREIDGVLATCGVEPETRSFFPHITIARLKSDAMGSVAHFIERHRNFTAVPFLVSCFHLYSSNLTPAGAIHCREQTYPLARAASMER